MKTKGQTGLEVIILVAGIFIIVLLVLNHYLSVSDSTIAMVIMKSNALEKIAELDTQHVLARIEYVETLPNTIDFTVLTQPTDLQNADVGVAWISEVEDKIRNNTKYANVSITFNS